MRIEARSDEISLYGHLIILEGFHSGYGVYVICPRHYVELDPLLYRNQQLITVNRAAIRQSC